VFTMPRVRCTPSGREVEVEAGTSLLAAARLAGLPVGSSCDGDGVCGKCGLRVVEGADALSPETPEETKAKAANRVDVGERLACLALVLGDVAITARYW
jgi:2Fe-2S ferredoxin